MVVDEDGPPCQGNCPNHGCLEASPRVPRSPAKRCAWRAPPPTAGSVARLPQGREITGALVTELAHDGDTAARDVVALIGTRLGVGIGNLVNMLDPEVIVVGGGVIAAGELLLAPAREVVLTRALPPARAEASIMRAHFGVEAGMIGAAVLALEGRGVSSSWPRA